MTTNVKKELNKNNNTDLLLYLTDELRYEKERTSSYLSYMYRTVQFTFAALIAIVVAALQVFNNEYSDIQTSIIIKLLFSYVLPACIYVFGTMYAFNAYALSACGKREDRLHRLICDIRDLESCDPMIPRLIMTKRSVSLLSYGVTLGFYLVIPPSSYIMALILSPFKTNDFFSIVLPAILIIIYWCIMIVIIINISKNFYNVNDATSWDENK